MSKRGFHFVFLDNSTGRPVSTWSCTSRSASMARAAAHSMGFREDATPILAASREDAALALRTASNAGDS